MKKSIILILLSLLNFSANSEPVKMLPSGKVLNSTESRNYATTRADEDFTYNGINYQIIDANAKTCKTKDAIRASDGTIITEANKCSGQLIIPEIVTYSNVSYTVTQIGIDSFFGNDITSVIMPNSIEAIDEGAFAWCQKLVTVEFSESLRTIGDCAFQHTGIETINLPMSLDYMGTSVFGWNVDLKSIEFPDNCTFYGWGNATLDGCTKLTHVKLPGNMMQISDCFFEDCTSLTEIHIPESVFYIGQYAFNNCRSLENIYINVAFLDDYAFYNCKSLKNLEISDEILEIRGIRQEVFVGCPLTNIKYYASVPASADRNIFSDDVYSSAILNMPNASLDVIKATTPWNLFTNIIAGGSSESSGEDFEYGGIKYTVLSEEELTCETKAGTYYPNENIHIPANVCSGTIVIPNMVYKDNIGYNVIQIGEGSFYNNDITSISLPNSVTKIDRAAFAGCKLLHTAQLSNTLKSIGISGFSGCESLLTIKLPDSLESIDTWGLSDCGLVSIEIPESCGLDNWGIFSNCKNLTSVKLPKTLKRIYGYVFEDCESITEITLPEGVMSIGNLCFKGCVNLKKINNTESLTEIGAGAFSGCESLESFLIPASIENIGDISNIFNDTIFANCHNLASLVWEADRQLPDNVLPKSMNPNFLLYVNNEAYAPAGFARTLVVKDETSGNYVCKNLIVTPGYPFYAVRNFISNNSTFTKEFTQETPIEGCAGWETIVLPFDAKSVSVKDARGELTPFALVYDFNTQYPFWLFEADSKGDWKDAFGIQAGVPYIISMPNNPSYSSRFNIDGPVTFSNPSPTLITTETTSPYSVTWASGRQFRSLWTTLDEEEAENAMGLNVGIDDLRDDAGQLLPPGSAFHIGVKPKPLEAYVTHNDSQRAFRIRGGDMAGILPVLDDKGLCMSGQDGDLVLRSIIDRNIEVYSASGMLVRRLSLKAGESFVVRDLTPGIYIVAGRKVAVR